MSASGWPLRLLRYDPADWAEHDCPEQAFYDAAEADRLANPDRGIPGPDEWHPETYPDVPWQPYDADGNPNF
jgi:hypothetical protein